MKNKAYADAEGGAGGLLAAIAVMLADSKVGGSVNAAFDGTLVSASQLTVQAVGGNFADTDTRVFGFGIFAGRAAAPWPK